MKISTERFGTLDLPNDQLFLFPGGLIGMERRRQWTLLPDPDQGALAWLQSTTRGELALPVISPRAYFADYRAKLANRDLSPLRLRGGEDMFLLAAVADQGTHLTANLRAPIVLNLKHRLGAQLVTTDEQPIRAAMPGDCRINAAA